MSSKAKIFLASLTVAVVAACVTINVYFPEAAAERAADRFIQDVLGEAPNPDNGDTDANDDSVNGNSAQMDSGLVNAAASLLARAGGVFISSAHAASPDINIDTPQIQSIKDRMAARHREHLAGWYDEGVIGFTRNGLVEIRDRSAVPLAERRNLERLVSEENSDRNAVYREIAVANNHPEWESDVRETFARQWVSNARSGWYYQDSGGNWQQK